MSMSWIISSNTWTVSHPMRWRLSRELRGREDRRPSGADQPGVLLFPGCRRRGFRNLERVGIWLLLARNGVDPPELDRDTAVKTAIDALSSGEGSLPHGVIFENGMELQMVYDGRIFPEYSYEAPLVTVEIPVSAKHSTYSLFLPMAEDS